MKKICILFFIITIIFSLMWNIPNKSFGAKENEPNLTYSLHIENLGWEKDFIHKNGEMAGFIDQDLKLEAIKIKLDNVSTDVSFSYRVHVQDIGWLSYVSNGAYSRNDR